MALCAGDKLRKQLDPGCKLSRRQPIDEGHQHGRRIGYMAVPDLPIVYHVFAHHDCMHNQYVSIHNRVCGRVPVPNRDKMAELSQYMRVIGRSLGTVAAWDLERTVDHYHGAKRIRYAEAAERYRAYGLTRDNAAVKMFIKCEKIKFVPGEGKRNPDPRAIQYRDPVYAIKLATYLKPIEEKVYQLRGNRLNGLPPDRVIGKGLNQGQRAALLRKKWERFDDPVALSLDASRFDQHVSYDHLLAEHGLYAQMHNDPNFLRMLTWQLNNAVTTSRGIRYRTRGKRMSGDMNTALGNCVLMVSMLGLFFKDRAIKWDCIDDGDDILLIIERCDLHLFLIDGGVSPLEVHFAELGMTLKIESHTDQFEKIEWCQSQPICVNGEWKFIRNPAKVLSGALVGNKWLQMKTLESRKALANTIGLCEAILNDGVPVLSNFARAIIRNADTKKQAKIDNAEQLVYRLRREIGKSWLREIPVVVATPITDETRLSFERAFGISVDEQMHWEQCLDNWAFSLEDPLTMPEPVDLDHWTWEAEDLEVSL